MKKSKKRSKICKPNQEINPLTNRCILKCKHSMERDPNNFSKCRKSCILPQVRNSVTRRCRKPAVKSDRKRKRIYVSPRKNPVRLVRKIKSPITERECPVCLNPTVTRTFCTSGRRHALCVDCYYRLLATGIDYCPMCREKMDRRPDL